MRVAVDEAGQDELAVGVDGLLGDDAVHGARISACVACVMIWSPFTANGAVFDDAAIRVHGDDGAVGDEEIDETACFGCAWLARR